MEVTTKSGFTCTINEDALGDWEVTEKLIRIQKENDITLLPETMIDLFGEEGYESAKEFVRNEKGRVPSQELSNLFYEVLISARAEASESKKK